MRKLIGILVVAMFASGCENNNLQECISGTVIGYEHCTQMLLVQVHNFNIGKPINYNGTRLIENVVKAPAPPGFQETGSFSFRYRPFDESRDLDLLVIQPCLAIYVTHPAPVIVITDYSSTTCE